MAEYKELELLATKSNELLDDQVNSYRQKHSNAGTIIGVIALFTPFFLSGLDNSFLYIKIASIVPILLFGIAMYYLLLVLQSRPLYFGIGMKNFDELAKTDYKKLLLTEIGANHSSFRENMAIKEANDRKYSRGVILTMTGIFFSFLILVTNIFHRPEEKKEPVQVEIIKTQTP